MNGAEHFRGAERLLDQANDTADTEDAASCIARAQVHATLALAAATALNTTVAHVGRSEEITDWGRIVQPEALKREPCTEGCEDEGRNGCYARCIERQAKRAAEPYNYEECPF